MKQLVSKAIVLSRTEYGEADRIVTVLTPEQGKLRLMARGVRKVKSKLAGGIELFSVSDITYIPGRGEISTLVSARLSSHYGNIVKRLDRVQLGYELIRLLNKATEDNSEIAYFELLEAAFQSLNDQSVDLLLIRNWFDAQLLKLAGHAPNLRSENDGTKLQADQRYRFDHDAMSFMSHQQGNFVADHIKTLRLLFSDHLPIELQQVSGLTEISTPLRPLLSTMLSTHLAL